MRERGMGRGNPFRRRQNTVSTQGVSGDGVCKRGLLVPDGVRGPRLGLGLRDDPGPVGQTGLNSHPPTTVGPRGRRLRLSRLQDGVPGGRRSPGCRSLKKKLQVSSRRGPRARTSGVKGPDSPEGYLFVSTGVGTVRPAGGP